MTNSIDRQKHPQGMVLIFTLGILALLAILGATIFLTTRDDAQVAKELQTGREAFTIADLTARLAIFFGRVTVEFHSGEVISSLSPGGVADRPEYIVETHNFSETEFQQLRYNLTDDLIRQRYLLATFSDQNIEPHVKVYAQYDGSSSKRQLIGTAAVGIGYHVPGGMPSSSSPGGSGGGAAGGPGVGSLGEEGYGGGSGGGLEVKTFLVITANGRVPTRGQGQNNPPIDPSNYFTGDSNAKHSIVTSIYRMQ